MDAGTGATEARGWYLERIHRPSPEHTRRISTLGAVCVSVVSICSQMSYLCKFVRSRNVHVRADIGPVRWSSCKSIFLWYNPGKAHICTYPRICAKPVNLRVIRDRCERGQSLVTKNAMAREEYQALMKYLRHSKEWFPPG